MPRCIASWADDRRPHGERTIRSHRLFSPPHSHGAGAHMSPEVITATGSTVATAVRRRAISAASFGTFVEYYDFVIYGYVATYIAQAFFPTGNSFVSLLLTFGAFAASFMARPLGAVIFAP